MDIFKSGNQILTEEDVKKMVRENERRFPLVEDLVFIEVVPKSGGQHQVFPALLRGYGEDEESHETNMVILDILQYKESKLYVAKIRVPWKHMGSRVRLWNTPPNDETMAMWPLKAAADEEKKEDETNE